MDNIDGGEGIIKIDEKCMERTRELISELTSENKRRSEKEIYKEVIKRLEEEGFALAQHGPVFERIKASKILVGVDKEPEGVKQTIRDQIRDQVFALEKAGIAKEVYLGMFDDRQEQEKEDEERKSGERPDADKARGIETSELAVVDALIKKKTQDGRKGAGVLLEIKKDLGDEIYSRNKDYIFEKLGIVNHGVVDDLAQKSGPTQKQALEGLVAGFGKLDKDRKRRSWVSWATNNLGWIILVVIVILVILTIVTWPKDKSPEQVKKPKAETTTMIPAPKAPVVAPAQSVLTPPAPKTDQTPLVLIPRTQAEKEAQMKADKEKAEKMAAQLKEREKKEDGTAQAAGKKGDKKKPARATVKKKVKKKQTAAAGKVGEKPAAVAGQDKRKPPEAVIDENVTGAESVVAIPPGNPQVMVLRER